MFNGVTIKLDKDNTDGDGRLDYQEYIEGTSPRSFDKIWQDYAWEFVQGFFAGDIIHETDSVAIVMGQIVGSFIPYVDIRDVVANLVYGDYGFAFLSFIGLATGGGDAAKASGTFIKFVIKNADNLPMMMDLFEGLLKNFPDLVADLSKNEKFADMVEGLAKADTSKLTRSEAEAYEQFLRNAGVSADVIKSGSKFNIYVKEVKPPGSPNTVQVYTDGYAQVNKRKIEVYIRGKIKEPENLFELKKRLRELKKIKNNNPKEYTKELAKEFKQIDNTIHNYERSKAMGKLLDEAGIADTIENNEMIANIILDSAKDVTKENTKISRYIEGVNGKVIVESWWILGSDNIPYCSTIIIIAVK